MQQNSFNEYLDQSGEIGEVTEIFRSIVYVSGLPNVHAYESVVFETGEVGQVMSLRESYCEVLIFSKANIRAGTRVTRTNKYSEVLVGQELLGKIVDASGKLLHSTKKLDQSKLESRRLDILPPGMEYRDSVVKPLETGFAIVDLLVPLGLGQRELVIGDRKTGKTSFLQGVMRTQAAKGAICIYALIGKRNIDLAQLINFCRTSGIMEKSVIVSSLANDSAGMIFLAPYTAMTIAEYFRDQGNDVLLILDDMTTHAQYYREISLQAKRFPGRSSYPGDIFYVQSRLLERAGSFKKGTITALPSAESILGDLSGYIQTNLMAITDGHLFFDTEIFNDGRRPAISTRLSVTRVGRQTQSDLLRDLSNQLSRFLVHYDGLKSLSHFGTEFEDRVSKDLRLGEVILNFFNQTAQTLIPINLSIVILGLIWNGKWHTEIDDKLISDITSLTQNYNQDKAFKDKCDQIVSNAKNFQELVLALKDTQKLI